jgi:hypothetical protein
MLKFEVVMIDGKVIPMECNSKINLIAFLNIHYSGKWGRINLIK